MDEVEEKGAGTMKRLWTRDFSILVLGSLISALGSAAAGIGFGILIYRETGSPFTLALFTVANILPRMVTAFVAGPFVDRHSRRKIIYTLDFLSAASYVGVAVALFSGYFDVVVFTVLAALFGVVDTVYQLAFMSLFPDAIAEGQFSKAYSLSSLIWPLSAALMAPVAAFMIERFQDGIAILMAFNAATYFIAACFETTMRIPERIDRSETRGPRFIADLKQGFSYYRKERGVLGIGLLFLCFAVVWAAHDVLVMPFFLTSDVFTIQDYSFLISANSIGRIVGGIVHYTFTYPPKKRFTIAVTVYFTIEIIAAVYLFLPYALMVALNFLTGLLAVTSFNIRMSATQSYLPPEMRGRINSTQALLTDIGTIAGCLGAGAVAEWSGIPFRTILLAVAFVSISAIFLFPLRMHRDFKKIYNADHSA
jgi:MFS family permease